MQKLKFINARNETIDLTHTPFGITEWEGFSNVDMEVQSQTVPFVDGSVYIDNLLESRELSVTVAIEDNNNLKKRYELRRELIRILNPKLGEGYLIYKNDHLEKQIRCIAHTPVFDTHNSDTSGTPKAQLTFTACEPYWEDLDSTLVNFSLTEQPVIVNEGDVETQVKLKISGQCTNVRVTNVTTGSQIGLTGTITEPVDISTEFGNKSVKGSVMGWSNIFGGFLHGVANLGENVVVVGTDGAVLYSKNGIEWKSQLSNTLKNLYGVTASFNFNLFVAVGSDGTVIHSEDGKNWTAGTSSSGVTLNSVACSNSRFIAVGEGGVIETSSDGKTFTAVVSPVSVDLQCVIYDGSHFVAVGKKGTIITSADGLTWAVQTSGTDYTLYGIAYDPNTGVYVAVGAEGAMLHSSDLKNWGSYETLTYTRLNSIAYNAYTGTFFIAGDNGVLIVGSDEWELAESGVTVNCMNVYFAKELGLNFIAGQGLLLRSSNGEEWIKCVNITDSQLHDVIYIDGLGLYIAGGENGNIAVSEDGDTWRSISVHINIDIYSIAYNPENGMLIAVGTGGSIIRSYDGINWTVVLDGVEPYKYCLLINEEDYLLINTDGDKLIIATSEGAGSLYSVVYNPLLNKFVAVGDRGRIVTSSDGSIWKEEASGVTVDLHGIAIYEGLMIAVGNGGTIIKSRDGVYWETVISNTSVDLKSINTSPTKTMFVAVGANGTVLTSQDGTRWRTFRAGVNVTLNAVCYSGVLSQFLAVGSDGTIVSSVDGTEWRGYSSGTAQSYQDVIYSELLGKYIAVGSRGTVMSSYISATENLINILSPNSDINFNLAVGDNILRVSCESGDPRVTIKFKNKYVGV